MKYIKNFEEIKYKNNDFVVSFSNPFYYIDKISYENDNIYFTNYATFNVVEPDEKIVIPKIKYKSKLNKKYINKILYSADNFQDCYNYLETIISVQKYNL